MSREDCSYCHGRGEDDGNYRRGPGLCSTCRGTGKVLRPDDEELIEMIDRLIRNRLQWGVR